MSPSLETLERIRDIFLDAASHAHADARAVLERTDPSKIARATSSTGGGSVQCDVECGVAGALFRALRTVNCDESSPEATVRTTSPYGVERDHTVRTLAQATLDAIPAETYTAIFADARLRDGSDSGTIYACTLERYAELREEGRAMCSKCGKFVTGGERGLWWHRKTKHADAHAEAMEAVDRERNALVAISSTALKARVNGADAAYVDNKSKKKTREDDLSAGVSAARSGDHSVLDALIAARRVKALPSPGLESARRGDLESLRVLVRDGWDPTSTSAVDRHGSNALLWAAGGGHVECVKFLIESCGMDPEKAVQNGRRSYAGRSALHWAARNGHIDVVKYLLSRGVDVDSKTSDGSTAFAWACWQGHINVMRYLVEQARCDYLHRNAYGCNCACWSAMGPGGVECCEYLRSLGVEFNLINANGHSALHKASQRGNREVCEWLLENAREIGLTAAHAAPDAERYDPSGHARVEGFADLAAWLAERQLHLPSA
ncbi:Ankyrin repeat [Ostreococcus tauri]|uniref:Ankyrin repeat n=1 Tax=Ostreococcus tauri TaxID=70448 RepID=Q01D56_OSTTA|nr:Ankyrin repeat [Ostreococcus tauri]CAL52747.1 Ankyrin repeat [Ostreococcus tauri]|eukprot:XP_003078007.1 Ankyrin repeat [Ostreococcus tauri]